MSLDMENAIINLMPENVEQKKINWKNVLIGVVIGAILVGLGVIIYLLLQPKSETPTTTPKTSTTSAKKDETANWKTLLQKIASLTVRT